MTDQQFSEIVEYMNNMIVPQSFLDKTDDEQRKILFSAREEITDEYPNIQISPRMAALQAIYNIEGEEEGVAMMHRQGIQDYTIKDVKAVLKRSIISPYVQKIIDNLDDMQGRGSSGRIGRLI